MAEYIEREALLAFLESNHDDREWMVSQYNADWIYSWIENQPSADVATVRHGRWMWDVETHGDPMYGVDEDFGYRCSECKVWADEYGVDGDIYEEPPTHILHFCPNCGARMDGE